MKLSVSAYRAHASAHKKILSSSYQTTFNYGSTAAATCSSTAESLFSIDRGENQFATTNPYLSYPATIFGNTQLGMLNPIDINLSSGGTQSASMATSKEEEEDSSVAASSDCKSSGQRTKSSQGWMKLRTTVQLSSAMQKKPPLKREDSFLKRFSTRQIPETQETMEETGSESASGDMDKIMKRRRRYNHSRLSVVNPDENFHFYWLLVLTTCVLYNLWTLIVRQSFPELQTKIPHIWFSCDCLSDIIFIVDIAVQLRTGYLEQGLMVYDDKKLATHYMRSRNFLFDLAALIPLDLLQLRLGTQPLLRFPRFFKVYRLIKFYYIVESRTVWPNLWRVVNLIHILLILAHWFGCFYFLLSEAEGFQGDWVYPYRPGDYATLSRKYLGSLYWSTLTLTTIGDLPTPETNAEYIFTIVSYLIGVFIFATIVGQVGNVITNRNANRLEFERLLDGAKTYMRHHKVPGGMKRRVLRWYDYSWSRGRIQGGGDINTALGLLPDKLKTELALHVNLSVLKKVTIFQECQPEFLHDLVLKMKAYIFTPGDSICRKGEVAREMFIIADGILEVLSETGKVLTTMKAGDFFGEIGILNLDGLNKRTADVRSVGYSELFSLSREDVLAAMKDYPDAQEILQTLGRKRLMEVRCVNKKHAKHLADKESIANKLLSDVSGIKSAIKKSRGARKSSESIELQPLQGTAKTPKGLLRRMPRVRSDEIQTESEEPTDVKDKTPSPIGAGLPLLNRLRLLKEKQDREERAVKPPPPLTPPSQTYVSSTISPQQSIQEEITVSQEVVGAGLPLMQRLKLLKAKEERLAKESRSKLQTTIQTTQVKNTITSTTVNSSTSATLAVTTSLSPSQMLKPNIKVSFRERINAFKQDIKKSSDSKNDTITEAKDQLIPSSCVNCKISSKPSTLSIKEKFRQFSHSRDAAILCDEEPMKPWSKLKLATVVSSCGSFNSLNNSFNEDDVLPADTSAHAAGSLTTSAEPIIVTSTDNLSLSELNRRISSSDSELKKCQPKCSKKPKPLKITMDEPKHYRSVNDLSPEYSGLPFVKKLKILNERQKLAELEYVIQTRSFSLDCDETENGTDLMDSLIRSNSEASGMGRPKKPLLASSHNVPDAEQPHFDTITTSPQCLQQQSPLSPESNETIERRQLKSILKKLSEEQPTAVISAIGGTGSANNVSVMAQDLKTLLRAPTVEGPPHSANCGGKETEGQIMFPAFSNETVAVASASAVAVTASPSSPTSTITSNAANASEQIQYERHLAVVSDENTTKSSASPPTAYIMKGSIDEQEYFGEVLIGIKHVIQMHLGEVQEKFQDKVHRLEMEVKNRDLLINRLKKRIYLLESHPHSSDNGNSLIHALDTGSTSSLDGIHYLREDSIDTILAPTAHTINERHRPKHRSKKRNSPKRYRMKYDCQDDSSEPDTSSSHEAPTIGPTRSYHGLTMTNVVGNVTETSQSVVLNIDRSSNTSSDESQPCQAYVGDREINNDEDEDNDDGDDGEELHCDDWEVRMLAAELDQREMKRQISSEGCSDTGDEGRLLRRRRRKESIDAGKTSINRTSTADNEVNIDENRPRAASLDQQSVRRQRCIFKAMSFERDKDLL